MDWIISDAIVLKYKWVFQNTCKDKSNIFTWDSVVSSVSFLSMRICLKFQVKLTVQIYWELSRWRYNTSKWGGTAGPGGQFND